MRTYNSNYGSYYGASNQILAVFKRFFLHHRCLAFISRRCTAALMDVASAGQNPPAPVSLTANAMRETFRAALGELSISLLCAGNSFVLWY